MAPKDYRPVALTSVLCKCMQRVVCDLLTSSVADKLDPLQLAYKAKRGVEDVCLTLLDAVTKNIDHTYSCSRILFKDFLDSSAFNTVNTNTLSDCLTELQVNPVLVKWIRDFLQDRSLHVTVNGKISTNIIINTGVPQGCVLSPILFSIYTNKITCNMDNMTLFKYANDMALVAHLTDSNSLRTYHQQVDSLITLIEESFLELNISKTKELCCCRRVTPVDSAHPLLQPLKINGQEVEQVEAFRYLGIEVDRTLSFSVHTEHTYKKAQQRLFLLRKLRSFNVSKDILTVVYRSLIESVLTYNISSWYTFLSVRDKSKLSHIIKHASKITGTTQSSLSDLHTQAVRRKATFIIHDHSTTHSNSFLQAVATGSHELGQTYRKIHSSHLPSTSSTKHY